MPEAFSAGVRLVSGIHRFREALAAGREVVDRLGGKVTANHWTTHQDVNNLTVDDITRSTCWSAAFRSWGTFWHQGMRDWRKGEKAIKDLNGLEKNS